MIKELAISTTTYEAVGGFRVDIVHDRTSKDGRWEAYIYHEGYGVKDLMFGVGDETETFNEFLELVIGNLGNYIKYYYDDHMVEDAMLQIEGEQE